jgi:hypothetical protein
MVTRTRSVLRLEQNQQIGEVLGKGRPLGRLAGSSGRQRGTISDGI